ncbi:6-phosphogluconolactonase [Geobacter metallireducens RCH3]|uniref:6-phosphogluconolactonase n=1 Tax=Geobacter metallireducens (strain ATCC 53774 / DSM 7210 / GS-15) TaxID=269799 RepID=Q39SD7_GEOMG|nr:6-phosphogluconolactonase [Geobacter metallireducens]ABB32837.1 6-phosphogluconolactonase [Geobacter metallireducens GS-15]EHP89030.1 6-phosphogluconolactonase [Geobacter metallireducens RCH3]
MIRVYLDREALSMAAAELFATAAHSAMRDTGRFAVALAGGDTPRRTYEILAHEPFRKRVPWEKTHVFWGDERCVPAADPRNNARMASRALLDHVLVPDGQVHPMVCGRAPQDAAKEYEALLRSWFPGELPRFDLILLGLGENGHTASLFPETPVLDERRRWVADVSPANDGMHRLTLTVPVINQASRVVFLVSGANKAPILREVLEGSPDPHRIPACLIRPAGQLVWLVDRDAARLLRNAT